MKRLIILMFALSMSVASWAQHLDFMGVPIEGNITDFTAKMRPRYPLKKKVGGEYYYIYYGPVFGHNCYLKAEYSRKTRTVYKVTVTPQFIDQNALADSLSVHYGLPEEAASGYKWNRPGGLVYLYLPEGYDPVLMYLDADGAERFKREK